MRPRQLGTGSFALVYAIWLLVFLLAVFSNSSQVKVIW